MMDDEKVLPAPRVANPRDIVAAGQRKPTAVWTELGQMDAGLLAKVGTVTGENVFDRIGQGFSICGIPNARYPGADRYYALAIRTKCARTSATMRQRNADFFACGRVEQLAFLSAEDKNYAAIPTEPDGGATAQEGEQQATGSGITNCYAVY